MQGGRGRRAQPEELAEMLYQSLLRGDNAMMRAMARQSVKRYAGMEPGRPVGGTYYLYRTLRNLDLDGMLERLMEQARQDVAGAAHAARGAPGARRVRAPHRPAQARRSRPRSAAAWSPTAASRPWPRRCASRCPRTSTSCTPAARRWCAAQGAAAADPAPGGAPGPQAPPRSQGRARLPQHGAPLAQLRRRAGRAQVQVPPPGQARDLRDRRHLRLGGGLRPVHAAPGVRDLRAVLAGAHASCSSTASTR